VAEEFLPARGVAEECRSDECLPGCVAEECLLGGTAESLPTLFLRCRPPSRSFATLNQPMMADSSSASVDLDVSGFRRTASKIKNKIRTFL